MLLRSLETLDIRAEPRQRRTRGWSPSICAGHPQDRAAVHYLGFLRRRRSAQAVFERQCTAPGSTFSFDIEGGEAEAFAFLDRLQVMKLAVSLGGTETLISHPGLDHAFRRAQRELREEIGLTDALIRISVGIEHIDDLIADLEQALDAGVRLRPAQRERLERGALHPDPPPARQLQRRAVAGRSRRPARAG